MEDGESSSEDSSDNSLNNLYLRKASSEDVDMIRTSLALQGGVYF
jgi:hypothetical protein